MYITGCPKKVFVFLGHLVHCKNSYFFNLRRSKILSNQTKYKIDREMKIAEKSFPLNSLVRLKRKYFIKKYFQKKSLNAPWSSQLFRVVGYKRPLSSDEPVGFYLSNNKDNAKIPGIYYNHEIKYIR